MSSTIMQPSAIQKACSSSHRHINKRRMMEKRLRLSHAADFWAVKRSPCFLWGQFFAPMPPLSLVEPQLCRICYQLQQRIVHLLCPHNLAHDIPRRPCPYLAPQAWPPSCPRSGVEHTRASMIKLTESLRDSFAHNMSLKAVMKHIT